MSVLLQMDTKAVTSIIHNFNEAWNNKDLNELSKFFSKDIIYSNPKIGIGFFKIEGKKVEGKFNVLKFCNEFLEKVKNNVEEKVILDIHEAENSVIVNCAVHNETMGLSSRLCFILNSELLIEQMTFSKITAYKKQVELSVISILIKQLKNKYFN